MINPPTRPYTEEEMAQVLKLLSTRKNNKECLSSPVPTHFFEPVPMKPKTPVFFENTLQFVNKDQGINVPASTIGAQADTVSATPGSTSKNRASVSRAAIWIIIGSTVFLISIYIYWEHHQKRQKDKNNNGGKNRDFSRF